MAGPGQAPRAHADPAVGLCSGCGHAAQQESAKGNVFWRCLAADRNPALLRYPPLPVVECASFEPTNDGA